MPRSLRRSEGARQRCMLHPLEGTDAGASLDSRAAAACRLTPVNLSRGPGCHPGSMVEMWGFEMTAPRVLSRVRRPIGAPRAGHVLVRVVGCGVCHTDIGYLLGEVAPRKGMPLVLGHEAS